AVGHDQVVVAVVEVVQTLATDHDVVAGAAVQVVPATLADQDVVAGTADQLVGTGVADEDVGPRTAGEVLEARDPAGVGRGAVAQVGLHRGRVAGVAQGVDAAAGGDGAAHRGRVAREREGVVLGGALQVLDRGEGAGPVHGAGVGTSHADTDAGAVA